MINFEIGLWFSCKKEYNFHIACRFDYSLSKGNLICFTIIQPISGRSNRSQMFFKIGVLKNLANFTGKHLCWNLFLIKLQALSPVTLLKGTPAHVFSCEICEMFKNIFFIEHLRWLLLFRSIFPFHTYRPKTLPEMG